MNRPLSPSLRQSYDLVFDGGSVEPGGSSGTRATSAGPQGLRCSGLRASGELQVLGQLLVVDGLGGRGLALGLAHAATLARPRRGRLASAGAVRPRVPLR